MAIYNVFLFPHAAILYAFLTLSLLDYLINVKMNNEVAKRVKNSHPIFISNIQSVNSTTSKISNFATLFNNYRNPVLVWHCQQSGEASLFVVFRSESIIITEVIYGASTISASLSDNDLIINNVGNWGRGIAIGFAA